MWKRRTYRLWEKKNTCTTWNKVCESKLNCENGEIQDAPTEPLTWDRRISRRRLSIIKTTRHKVQIRWENTAIVASIDRGIWDYSSYKAIPNVEIPRRTFNLRCRTRLGNICENKRKSLRVSSFTSDLAGNVDYSANNGYDSVWIRKGNGPYPEGDLKQKSERRWNFWKLQSWGLQ